MVNERKDAIDWCCEELESMTAVRPHGGGRTWDWTPHIAELGFSDRLELVRVLHEPNETITNTLDPDMYGDDQDFTFRYCPFCGTEVNNE